MAITSRSRRIRFGLLSTAAVLITSPALAQNPAPNSPPDVPATSPQTENQSPPTQKAPPCVVAPNLEFQGRSTRFPQLKKER